LSTTDDQVHISTGEALASDDYLSRYPAFSVNVSAEAARQRDLIFLLAPIPLRTSFRYSLAASSGKKAVAFSLKDSLFTLLVGKGAAALMGIESDADIALVRRGENGARLCLIVEGSELACGTEILFKSPNRVGFAETRTKDGLATIEMAAEYHGLPDMSESLSIIPLQNQAN
jgi:hypothetical protein